MKKIVVNSGVSFIEMIMVVAILVILISIAAPVFIFFQRGLEFNNNIEETINVLKIARNKTLASEGASQYGVYFDNTSSPHQYILFKGESFALRDDSFDEINNLSDNTEVYNIDLNGGNEIVFDKVTGNTSQPGSISLRLKTDITKTKTIYIEGSGYVKLTAPIIPSDANRVKDSRHIHFDLGWSIQDAVGLKFDFVDAGQIKTIDMANYFNDDKTEFDWQGTFLIGGVDQIFRIHSHSLDAFGTILCIHRDRNNNKNTEQVMIYIIDGGIEKNIAHYLADANDTVDEGLFGGTKEIQ